MSFHLLRILTQPVSFVLSTYFQVYVVYLILILVQIFNKIASVLLYALMCCIYATLFAVVIYFCPRLINLMRPSLQRHRGLALRLIVATTVCILIFGIHCINYARLVIAPPRKVYWWYQYGTYMYCSYNRSVPISANLFLTGIDIFLVILPSLQESWN